MCSKCNAVYDKGVVLSAWRTALLFGSAQTVALGTRTCRCGNVMQVENIYTGMHDPPREYWNQLQAPVEVD
jgi:hypothetical protein